MDLDATWYGGRLRPRTHCARWEPSSPSPKKGAKLPIFGPCLLWPNSQMDQDATWYEGRPRLRPHYVTWGPGSPLPKGAQPPHPIFGQCLLWPTVAHLSYCWALVMLLFSSTVNDYVTNKTVDKFTAVWYFWNSGWQWTDTYMYLTDQPKFVFIFGGENNYFWQFWQFCFQCIFHFRFFRFRLKMH